MDTSRLIVEAAALFIDTKAGLIDIDQVPEPFKKKADGINRCLQFIRTSEKKLFALQQKLLEDSKTQKEPVFFIQPHPPDVNLLNQELLTIIKNNSPDIYEQFIEPELIKEQQKEKLQLAERRTRGEAIPPDSIIHPVPQMLDAVIFLHTPFAVFPLLNSVREIACLTENKERRLYLLDYMERWLYKFIDFLNNYGKGMSNEALLIVSFVGKHQHYPIILEVIKFLHQEENWEGPSAQIQRYNVVKLFLLFKRVLLAHLKRKQAIPSTFNAILSEFTHPFIVEEIDFSNDPLMIITLGFYNEAQRFQFLANLKKKRLAELVGLYQQILLLLDPAAKQSHTFRVKYMEILRTISKIIKKSHMLTDPNIPQTIRSTLRRELSRQILAEEGSKSVAIPNQASAPKQNSAPTPVPNQKRSIADKLAHLQKKARDVGKPVEAAEVQEATPPSVTQPKKAGAIQFAPPPRPGEIVVYRNQLMRRNYDSPQEFSFPLVPDQVARLQGWAYTDTNIVCSHDTLFYLFSSFKARGHLKFTEMLELARIPFRFEFFAKTKTRHVKFINVAHLIAMRMNMADVHILLAEIEKSGQLTSIEVSIFKELYPLLIKEDALGLLQQLSKEQTSYNVDSVFRTKAFYQHYEEVAEKMFSHYPYFQQVAVYWDFLDHVLRGLAKGLDREKCAHGYQNLDSKRLKKYMSRQQPKLHARIVKELKAFPSSFLAAYLGARLTDMLEFKISPDLLELCESSVVQLP